MKSILKTIFTIVLVFIVFLILYLSSVKKTMTNNPQVDDPTTIDCTQLVNYNKCHEFKDAPKLQKGA